MASKKIRVLVVDDSALVRKVLSETLSTDPDLEIIGAAADPYDAREKILALDPDVLTLDIEMPRMDGLTFLKVIMKHRPMPVVIFSTLTSSGSAAAYEALQAGAVDLMEKPTDAAALQKVGFRLGHKIKAAAMARVRSIGVNRETANRTAPTPSGNAERGASGGRLAGAHRRYSPRHLILLGASTGGTEALKTVLTQLPADLPGICVVQHIPAHFSTMFAQRLNSLCDLEVREAQAGDRVSPGRVLIAPGGYHLLLRWVGDHYEVLVKDGPAIHHQRPAVDVLFDSAEKCGAAPYCFAGLLTGMGVDGAAGLAALRTGGASTLAQDEESCVVFGMPREAIRLGAAQQVVPLGQIAQRINAYASNVAQH